MSHQPTDRWDRLVSWGKQALCMFRTLYSSPARLLRRSSDGRWCHALSGMFFYVNGMMWLSAFVLLSRDWGIMPGCQEVSNDHVTRTTTTTSTAAKTSPLDRQTMVVSQGLFLSQGIHSVRVSENGAPTLAYGLVGIWLFARLLCLARIFLAGEWDLWCQYNPVFRKVSGIQFTVGKRTNKQTKKQHPKHLQTYQESFLQDLALWDWRPCLQWQHEKFIA